MSYALTAAVAEYEPFRARVRACILDVARDISNENWTGPATDIIVGGQTFDASTIRATRIQLAYAVAADPAIIDGTFAWIVAANEQIQASTTVTDGVVTIDDAAGKADDAALKYVVSGNWDRVALFYAQRPAA